MTKKNSIIGGFLLRLSLVILSFLLLIIGLYFALKFNQTKSLTWKALKPEKNFNLFVFFGWWNLLIVFLLLAVGIYYRYPWGSFLEALLQRRRLLEFVKGVNMAVVSADVGRGKTLLLSIIANSIKNGRKKLGFVSNVPNGELLSYKDLNFDEEVKEFDSYRIPKYFFLDETNFYIDGVDFYKNRLYHRGVAYFLQISRHHQVRLWISATRDNHVWVAIRQIVNNHVRLGGLKYLMTIFGHTFFTLRVQFFAQSGELEEEFNILISDLDFTLYDSYWLKDTSYFRPREGVFVQPKIADLSAADQKLMDLNLQQSKQLVKNIYQTFPVKKCSNSDWDKNVNNFIEEQKKSTNNKETANKNFKPFYPKKQSKWKKNLGKRQKNISLQEFMRKRAKSKQITPEN